MSGMGSPIPTPTVPGLSSQLQSFSSSSGFGATTSVGGSSGSALSGVSTNAPSSSPLSQLAQTASSYFAQVASSNHIVPNGSHNMNLSPSHGLSSGGGNGGLYSTAHSNNSGVHSGPHYDLATHHQNLSAHHQAAQFFQRRDCGLESIQTDHYPTPTGGDDPLTASYISVLPLDGIDYQWWPELAHEQ
eukprot:maker-scaffold383_size189472-snap-gene-0.35 protein:Tk11350 transcript:maker-scaffold383_size189472-snap-gene-0.35-mRNA-1 annotation:"-denpendent receptor"